MRRRMTRMRMTRNKRKKRYRSPYQTLNLSSIQIPFPKRRMTAQNGQKQPSKGKQVVPSSVGQPTCSPLSHQTSHQPPCRLIGNALSSASDPSLSAWSTFSTLQTVLALHMSRMAELEGPISVSSATILLQSSSLSFFWSASPAISHPFLLLLRDRHILPP